MAFDFVAVGVGSVLTLLDLTIGPFLGHRLVLLGILACLVTITILRRRSYLAAEETLQRAERELASAHQLDRNVASELDNLVRLCATTTGPNFFESVARQLCIVCGTDFITISEISPRPAEGPPLTAETLAYVEGNTILPNLSYDLEGTPCQSVPTQGFCHYERNIADLFPQDVFLKTASLQSYMAVATLDSTGARIGIVAAIGRAPFPDAKRAERALRAVAGRVGAEIERAAAERALRESESRLQAVLESAPGVAIQWFDHAGRVIRWNRASEVIYGFTREEALGRTLDQLILSPQDGAKFLDTLGSIAETGRPTIPSEFSFRTRDGSRGWCLSTIFAIPGKGAERWFGCIDVDLTKLRRAEEELRQSQKLRAIGQLAGGVAHDFNNLLFVINGYGEMLLREVSADQRSLRQPLEAMVDAGRRAASLTRQLLTFARRQTTEPRVLDLQRELHLLRPTLLGLLQSADPATSDGKASPSFGATEPVTLRYEFSDAPTWIRIDPTQLQQILMNLVVNARDAMPQGGMLSIGVEAVPSPDNAVKPSNVIRLTVRDTGIGMSADAQERIFEPFFTTKEGRGTGLGLATVYGAVRESSGSIMVDSEEGKGTRFQIEWPIAAPPNAAEPSPAVAAEASSSAATNEPTGLASGEGSNVTILLVDDDAAVRRLLATYLRSLGYIVIETGSGSEGLAIAQERRADIRLLLTDLRLGDMDGRELAAQVSKDLPQLPVLFISGHTDGESFRGPDGQVTMFLQKPFTFATLARIVGTALAASGPESTQPSAPTANR